MEQFVILILDVGLLNFHLSLQEQVPYVSLLQEPLKKPDKYAQDGKLGKFRRCEQRWQVARASHCLYFTLVKILRIFHFNVLVLTQIFHIFFVVAIDELPDDLFGNVPAYVLFVG